MKMTCVTFAKLYKPAYDLFHVVFRCKSTCLRTHMQDLKDVTRDVHYENYRLKRIRGGSGAHPAVRERRYPPPYSYNLSSLPHVKRGLSLNVACSMWYLVRFDIFNANTK